MTIRVGCQYLFRTQSKIIQMQAKEKKKKLHKNIGKQTTHEYMSYEKFYLMST